MNMFTASGRTSEHTAPESLMLEILRSEDGGPSNRSDRAVRALVGPSKDAA
jgi:hypothetical protein